MHSTTELMRAADPAGGSVMPMTCLMGRLRAAAVSLTQAQQAAMQAALRKRSA
jgi:hypothetical protein